MGAFAPAILREKVIVSTVGKKNIRDMEKFC
jgi:hypothetical protein